MDLQSIQYSIKVVGAFDVLDREGRSVRPAGRKDCALIAMLALSPNHRQTRTWLQEKLWGDRGPAQAAQSLRQSLTTLRGMFDRDADVLHADRTWVWLDPAKLDFDHLSIHARGELLSGFDLREEGFNDWLREVREEYRGRSARSDLFEVLNEPERRWYFDPPMCAPADSTLAGVCEFVCDALVESLSVIGIDAAIDRRNDLAAARPRAADMVVCTRAQGFDTGGVVSIIVTDGFGTLKWQARREIEVARWHEVRAVQIEMAQLLQDFVIRFEAASLRGPRWSAYANGCQALMGVLVPGSIPVREIARCCEAAIAADEKGVYHSLLGFARLLAFGERESKTAPDADEVMQSFRTALRLEPGNGLVQALAGHGYGFLLRDLDRNATMIGEALRLLPGSGAVWTFHAISLAYRGRFDDAVHAATKAVALCQGTMAQPMAQSAELFARMMAGDTRGAIRAGEHSLDALVFRPTIVDLMTAYSREGRLDEGRSKLELLVAREPGLSIDLLNSPDYPIVNSTHRLAIVEAAEQLGLS